MSAFGGGGGGFGGGQDSANISLNLTALMDILSNLLFFLLASYTSQAVEVQQKPDLQLPSSSSQAKLTPSLTITVTRHEIQVAGVPVANVDGARILTNVEESGRIVPLYERLLSARSSRAAAGQADTPDKDLVLLLADRSTDAVVVTRVLKTAGMAGFLNARFGVLSQ